MDKATEAVPLFWSVLFSITALKFLLIPSYKSTDFEVHRNWLAITHSLSFEKWYYESTSEWTLDYPPLFAWFEYVLSSLASFFDSEMLVVLNLNYASKKTIVFQRFSVIFTDLVYAFAVYKCCCLVIRTSRRLKLDVWSDERFVLCILLLTNVGLLLVDHIHFQYNGFLFGILLLSVVRIVENRCIEGAFWFAVLINLKHIFIYMAPAYFIYLFRSYCFQYKQGYRLNWKCFSPLKFLKLGLIVILVFSLSFGPFIYAGQLNQVLSRLFPFKRGLSHAYWAPNFWALYNFADKIIAQIGVRIGIFDISASKPGSLTGGLVQEYEHSVLPSVSPLATMILSALSMIPSLVTLWQRPNRPWEFLRSLVLCTFGAFMFGWHVHEKAILMILIPFSLLAVQKSQEASLFLVLSTVGHYSLFPLLFKEAEFLTKVLMLILYASYAFYSFSLIYWRQEVRRTFSLPLLNVYETAYLFGIVVLQLYGGIVHQLLRLDGSLPFLPLMLTSVYCAVGVIYVWLKLSWLSWKDGIKHKVQ